MDILAFCIGKKMIYRRAYAKTTKILVIMSFFGLREWNFGNRNVQALLDKTKTFRERRGDLEFDMRKINWHEYFRNYIPGIKRYYFKENATNVKRLAAYYNWYAFVVRVSVGFKCDFVSLLQDEASSSDVQVFDLYHPCKEDFGSVQGAPAALDIQDDCMSVCVLLLPWIFFRLFI
jgi:hypothetical protein